MWSGRATAGEFIAPHYAARVARAKKQNSVELARLKSEIKVQQDYLSDWVVQKDNQAVAYLGDVRAA